MIVSFELTDAEKSGYEPGSICTSDWNTHLETLKFSSNQLNTAQYYVFDMGKFSTHTEGVRFLFWGDTENNDYATLNSCTLVKLPDNPGWENCGEPVTLTGTTTQYTWNNLDRTASDGSYWIYTVEETAVKQGDTDVSNLFTTTITPDNGLCDTGTFTITNTKGAELTVQKVWKAADGVTDLTPDNGYSVVVQLYRVIGTEETPVSEQKTLANTNGWKYTWIGLPAVGENGTEYAYRVKEVRVYGGSGNDITYLFHVTVDYGDGADSIGPSGTVTVTNTLKSTYTLPETGGGGAKPYTLGGLLLCFTAGALLLYSHSRRRKEDSISS